MRPGGAQSESPIVFRASIGAPLLKGEARHRRARRSGAGIVGPRERRRRGAAGAKPPGSKKRRATGAPAGAERGSWGPASAGAGGSAGAKPPGSNLTGAAARKYKPDIVPTINELFSLTGRVAI